MCVPGIFFPQDQGGLSGGRVVLLSCPVLSEQVYYILRSVRCHHESASKIVEGQKMPLAGFVGVSFDICIIGFDVVGSRAFSRHASDFDVLVSSRRVSKVKLRRFLAAGLKMPIGFTPTFDRAFHGSEIFQIRCSYCTAIAYFLYHFF